MAKLKSVYFSDTDPSKWFENREDAERFDKGNEVAEWVVEHPDERTGMTVSDIVARIMERYEITQRWDYKAPEGEQE